MGTRSKPKKASLKEIMGLPGINDRTAFMVEFVDSSLDKDSLRKLSLAAHRCDIEFKNHKDIVTVWFYEFADFSSLKTLKFLLTDPHDRIKIRISGFGDNKPEPTGSHEYSMYKMDCNLKTVFDATQSSKAVEIILTLKTKSLW